MSIFGTEDPEVVEVKGRPLCCLVCQHGTFYQRSAQLHSGVATFFNLEWASPTCICVVCSECGHIHWFLPSP
jgi:formate-dependent nitrite reductase cytochrome c552 subunit